MYLYQNWLINSYFILWVQYCFVLFLKLSIFRHWESIHLAPVLLWHISISGVGSFFCSFFVVVIILIFLTSYSLLSGMIRCLSYIFPSLALKSATSPRFLGSFYWRKGIENKDLGVVTVVVFPLEPLSR